MVGMRAMDDFTCLPTGAFHYTPKNLSLAKVITNNICVNRMAKWENKGKYAERSNPTAGGTCGGGHNIVWLNQICSHFNYCC
jgi:hypothetical protein